MTTELSVDIIALILIVMALQGVALIGWIRPRDREERVIVKGRRLL